MRLLLNKIRYYFYYAFMPPCNKYLDYKTKTPIIFPLTGETLIGTGGKTKKQNPDHIHCIDQRFAMDIVALAPGSPAPKIDDLASKILSGVVRTYRGEDGKDNANYYCFGRPIVAPGAGIIADARDDVYDNIPGQKSAKVPPGNFVIIDHLNGEFSMLAHLKENSVLVTKGDEVSAGDPIGLCGNSGHSNLPHLHYHLQNSPRWFEGEGLPVQFRNYYANGKFVESGEPVQGEIISHKPLKSKRI